MTQADSIEPIENQLRALGLSFARHFARALVALLSARKISLHQIAHLMPGNQNLEANRQQLRRCLDHETTTASAWTRTIAALLPKASRSGAGSNRMEAGRDHDQRARAGRGGHGCAVPLLWSVLPKPGASDTTERKDLLERS
jgi:hypothetical protein